MPSPYLVINAVTESMLNQLTEGDEKLRGDLGKEVLESYLYDIAIELPINKNIPSKSSNSANT